VLASGHADGTIKFWRTNDGSLLRDSHHHAKAVTALAFSPNGDLFASGGEDNAIIIQTANEGHAVQTLKGIDENCGITEVVQGLSFSPDGSVLAYGSSCAIALWHVGDWKLIRILKRGEIGGASSIIFLQAGQTLLAGHKLYRVSDGALLSELQCYGRHLAASPIRDIAASGTSAIDKVGICSLKDGRVIKELIVAPNKRYDLVTDPEVAFDSSGMMLVSAASGAWRDKGSETTLRFWETQTWRMLHNETIPLMDTMALAMSYDGNMIAAGGYLSPSENEGGVIRIWRLGEKGGGPSNQSIAVRTPDPEAADSTEWTELNRGQKKGAFQFSQTRTLLYNGRPILGVRFRATVQKIAISPRAVAGKYAICATSDDIDSVAFLLRLDNHSGKQLAIQGPPLIWAAWSPTGAHALVGSYYEADEALYSLNLPSGVARRFSFKVSKEKEEENYDLDNLSWIDNGVFRMRVTVNCNPYTDDNCSDQDRKKVLREYEVQANVVTLTSSAKRR